MKIKSPRDQDFFAGLLFIFFGLVFGGISINYPKGTSAEMGPGYLPLLTGGILILPVHRRLDYAGKQREEFGIDQGLFLLDDLQARIGGC